MFPNISIRLHYYLHNAEYGLRIIFYKYVGSIAKTLTCIELHKRAEKIAALLQEKGKIEQNDHVGTFKIIAMLLKY